MRGGTAFQLRSGFISLGKREPRANMNNALGLTRREEHRGLNSFYFKEPHAATKLLSYATAEVGNISRNYTCEIQMQVIITEKAPMLFNNHQCHTVENVHRTLNATE